MSELPVHVGEVHYVPHHGWALVTNVSGRINHATFEVLMPTGRPAVWKTSVRVSDVVWKNQHHELPDWVHAELMKRALQGELP